MIRLLNAAHDREACAKASDQRGVFTARSLQHFFIELYVARAPELSWRAVRNSTQQSAKMWIRLAAQDWISQWQELLSAPCPEMQEVGAISHKLPWLGNHELDVRHELWVELGRHREWVYHLQRPLYCLTGLALDLQQRFCGTTFELVSGRRSKQSCLVLSALLPRAFRT